MKHFFTLVFFMLIIPFLVSATVINVPGNQATIQAGINATTNGDTVLVADNTYFENINFNGKAITVASHFLMDGDTSHISATIINGSQPNHSDSGSVVYLVSGEDTTSILCGFTITGGTGTYLPYANAWDGGGIICWNAGAKIINNYIENNSIVSPAWAGSGGIGVSPLDSHYWVIIKHNRIKYNITQGVNWTLGAAIVIFANGVIEKNIIKYNEGKNLNGANPALVSAVVHFGGDSTGSNRNTIRIINNVVSNNSVISDFTGSHGAGIHGVGSQAIITGNTITNNTGDGITHALGGGIDLVRVDTGSVIANNYIGFNKLNSQSSRGGGIRVLDCKTKIYNNIIVGNEATRGAGIYVRRYGKDIIYHNTLINNYASGYGAGLYIDNAHPKIFNTILWDSCGHSTNEEILIENGGSLEVYHSDIKGGWTGTGYSNIDLNPLFVPGDSLYNLSDSSPCIGTGIDSLEFDGKWYYAPPFDYDGDPRPMPVVSEPDIGAQEHPFGAPNRIHFNYRNIPERPSLSQNYPNPFNPNTTIEFTIPKTEIVTLKVYNVLGQEVSTLVSDKLTPGNYRYTWDASGFASGIYYYRLSTNKGFVHTRKLVLMK